MRDARIAAIYEGTNGIQAIDLVTRKLPLCRRRGGARLSRRAARDRRSGQAANDPAFGATGRAARAKRSTASSAPRAWLLSAARQRTADGARRRDAVSAAVRQRAPAAACWPTRRSRRCASRRRAGRAHRDRALLRREHRGAARRAGARRVHRRRRRAFRTPPSAALNGMSDIDDHASPTSGRDPHRRG